MAAKSPTVRARTLSAGALIAGLASLPAWAAGGGQSHFLNAPLSHARPSIELAVQSEWSIRLPDGKGIARALIDNGVSQADAAAAAKLAAGHLGQDFGGCTAKVAYSRSSDGSAVRVERIKIYTLTSQTVIERRLGELVIASQTATGRSVRLV